MKMALIKEKLTRTQVLKEIRISKEKLQKEQKKLFDLIEILNCFQ